MARYEVSPREREARMQADRLNAILQNSSIASGSEAAMLRAREQAAARQQQRKAAEDRGNLEATLGVRQDLAADKLASDQALLAGIYGLTAPEQRTVRGEQATYSQLENAADEGQAVMDAGGNFAGTPHVVINALRDWEFTGAADLLAQAAYNQDERSARGAFANAIANWRKNLSGAQVTGIERVLGADWDPTATSDQEEAIARARRLQSFINTNRESLGLPPLGIGKPTEAPATPGLSDSAKKYYGG